MKVIVTGSSSGIGHSLALRFFEAGHDVWGIARREQQEFAPGQKSGSFRSSRVDVTCWDQLDQWRQEATRAWGGAEALVCCAGMQGPLGPAMHLTAPAWQDSLNTNLNGTFNTLLAAHELLLHAGRRAKVVCFSGGGSTGPRPFFTPYAVAKAGIVRMVENLAHEWAGSPIDINALAPGAVNTRMTDEVIEAGPAVVGKKEHEKTVEQKGTGGTPLSKVGEVVDFLISKESDGITGRLISGLWDPYRSLPHHRPELDSSDIYTLRRIVPEDRAKQWS